MSEIVRKRRRWPWMVLALMVLLVGGPIAWQFRPLNAYERKLVGAWRTSYGVNYTFKSDRTVEPSEVDELVTTWSATRLHLHFRFCPRVPGSWDAVKATWQILTGTEKLSAENQYSLDERGRLHLLPTKNNPEENIWERVE